MKIKFLLLVFLLATSLKAQNISEFEIEGISIGDSALDYVSKDHIVTEIKRTSEHYTYLKNQNDFGEVYILNGDFDTYEQISFFVKPNDKFFKIYMLRGILEVNSLNECLDLQKEIEDDLKKIFIDYSKRENNYPANMDPSGKSTKYDVIFDFSNGDNIALQCSDWSKEIKQEYNWINGISVAILTSEFVDWITDY